MESTVQRSPQLTARMAGLFYVLMLLAGGLATYARRGLIVTGDAAATAANITAHLWAFQLSYAGDVLVVAFYVVVTVFVYRLFKPVDRNIALIAALMSLVACAVQAAASAFEIAPLVVLGRAQYLSVFPNQQLYALSFMFLRLYAQAYGIALVFFAIFGVLVGYLTYKSTFLPRILGVLMIIAGLAWLTFLSPILGAMYLRPYIMSAAIGEGLLFLWLLVKGVNVDRWKAFTG